MKIAVRMLFLLAAALLPIAVRAQAPSPATPAGPVYMVTFVETGAASAPGVAVGLSKLAAAARRENGNAGFLALRESGRPGRFAVVEAWRDKAAADNHDAAAKPAWQAMQPRLSAPPDRRACIGLDVAPTAGGGAVYVLTHVDVVPPAKDAAVAAVKQLAAESRKETGDLRFDVLQQSNRANHLFLVEAWRDRATREAHLMAASTRAFRAKLLPLQGALYDERVYEPLR